MQNTLNTKKHFPLVFLLFFLIQSGEAISQVIGAQWICDDECYSYQYLPSGEEDVDFWVVTYNTLSDTLLSDQLNEILICFDFGIPTQVAAYSSDGELLGSLGIRIGEFTEIQLEIVSPIACQGTFTFPGSQTCLQICEGTIATFRIKDLIPEEIEWDFWGNGEIVSSDNQQITIQFFEAGGNNWISYFGIIKEGCFFEGGDCIEIIEEPVASFISFPEAENDTITVCRGQSIEFTSTTSAENIDWYAGSAGSGEGNSFSVEYHESGFFEVSQKVSEICDCEDIKTVVVQVLDADAPVIYCTGSVCMGDTVTYRADPSCDPYIWDIAGSADIISGGNTSDDFIQVHWTGGASGTVSLTTACHDICPFPAIEQVFILGDETRIQGPERVCPNRTYSFRVDNRDGTNFSWSAGFAAIQSGNGTNEITARFFNTPQQPWIAVYIEDCTRDCIQTDTLWLDLTTPLDLNGPNRLCPEEEAIYTLESNSAPVDAIWEVRDEHGNLIAEETTLSSSFSFSPPYGGTFTITATPGNDDYCDPFAVITLIAADVTTAEPLIEGETIVCPWEWYTYSVEIPEGEPLSIIWEVHDGSEVSEHFSSEINVQWTEGTDKLIRVQWIDIFSGCASDWVELSISEIEEIEISGQDRSCVFSESFFSIDSNLIGEVSWELSIPSMGTIVEQEDPTTVIVRWKESGMVELTARYCSFTVSIEIEVLPEIEPVVIDSEVCRGGLVAISPTESFSSYEWYSNGVQVCNIASCELGFGDYLLIVEDEFGCQGRTRFKIREIPSFEVNIINLDPAGICDGDSVRLVSSLPYSPDYVFTWFFHNTPIAFDTDTIVVGEWGNYSLEVLQLSTGCNERSRFLRICEHCDPRTILWDCSFSSDGQCENEGDLDPLIDVLTEAIGNCNHIRFEVINPGIVDSTVLWFIVDGDSSVLLAGNPVDYFFNNAANHYVRATGTGLDMTGDTINFRSRLITLEFENELDFDFLPGCVNEELEFQSFIMTGDVDSLIGVEWNFGDPASGVNNISTDLNPTHVYTETSFYDVLLIANFGSCSLEVEKTIEVRPVPDAGFMEDGSPCIEDLVMGLANLDQGFYEWNFLYAQDSLLVHDKNNPGVFRYDSSGTYIVELRVEDLFGCTNSHIETIEINESIAIPEIVADRPFPLCEGDWVELSVIGGNFSDFIWSNGSEDSTTIAESSGQYSVSVRDENNCLATSGVFPVEYEPTPAAEVLGRIPGQSGIVRNDTLTACFGSPVELFSILEENNHSFSWNTTDDSRILIYDGLENPFLDPGLHQFELTVQNTTSGCESVSDPFYVRIFPTPEQPLIATTPDGLLCSGDSVQMEVSNIEATLDYFWSTGSNGTTFSTTNAGQYFVTAENEWGCRAESQPVVINPSPNTAFFPKGCLEECEEISICLPVPDGYQITEWIRDGQDLSLPADPTEVAIAESGSYQIGVVNSNGCYAQSDIFEISIFDGTASLSGLVFLDRDFNGVVDPLDSLLSGVMVYLWEDGIIVDSMLTDDEGEYSFEYLPLGEYMITVSPDYQPSNWLLVQDSVIVELDLCAAIYLADPLIFNECQAEDEFFEFTACSGDSIEVNGQYFYGDTTMVIEVSGADCLANEFYSLLFFSRSDTISENLSACQGYSIEWRGMTFYSDTTFAVIHQDVNGCDSVEVVEMVFLELEQEETRVQLCPGEVFEFEGQVFDRDTAFSQIIDSGGEDCGIMNHVEIITSAPWQVDVLTHSSCPGEEDGFAEIVLTGIDLSAIESIELNGELKEIDVRIDQLSEGTYSIIMLDTIGCEENATFSILSDEPLEVDLQDLELDCDDIGGILQVEVMSGADDELSILWENGSTGNQLFVAEEGEYSVEVSNRCQSFSLAAKAFFDPVDLELAYYVPNAFSPNDDGINDVFKPYFPPDADLIEFDFSVYDRWGKKIFQTGDPAFGWDGISEDQLSDQAVFVWVLEAAVYKCGQFIYVFDYSDVTVLR